MRAVINRGAKKKRKKEEEESGTMLQIMCSCTNFSLCIGYIRPVRHDATKLAPLIDIYAFFLDLSTKSFLNHFKVA